MQKTIITCDHCGKETNDDYYAGLSFESRRSFAGEFLTTSHVHGCTQEHLGLALAKTFGIPIDGNLATVLNDFRLLRGEHDEQHRKLTSTQAEVKTLQEQLAHTPPEKSSACVLENGRLQSRIAELDNRLNQAAGATSAIGRIAHELFPGQTFDSPHLVAEAVLQKFIAAMPPPVDAAGKTPGQVGFEAWQSRFAELYPTSPDPWSEETADIQECEEASAQAVLRAFGGAEVLQMVRDRIAAAPGEACEYYVEIIDAELAKLPSAPSLTVPIKPTKPVKGIGDALAQSFGVGKPDDVTSPPQPGVFVALGVCDECGGLGSHRPWCKT